MTYSLPQKRSASAPVSRGTSVTGLLGVAFIILKLCGVIAWSWWWVLAPFWIPFVLVVLLTPIVILLAARKRPGALVPRRARTAWGKR